ncbi:hypothetical protein FS837_001153, partial [Tulasnella sp. UAMH 9824]
MNNEANTESNTVTKRKVAKGQETAEEEDQIPNPPMTNTQRGRAPGGDPVIFVPPPTSRQ